MKSAKPLALALGILLATLLGGASRAEAQYGGPPPPRGMYRSNFLVGFAVGGGSIIADECSTCGGGGALEFHIGGMVNPRLGVMGEVWGIGRPVNGGTLSNGVLLGAVQYWATPMFWLKGGLGVGNISFEDDVTGESVGESALAIAGGAGIEIIQSYNFALDLQFRVSHTWVPFGGASNVAFLVGFNWY